MSCAEEIKKIRQKSFLSQEAFARELCVSFSSVNRWESGKSKPNLSAMKKLMLFCQTHCFDFTVLEHQWINQEKDEQ
jgi:DNA-binding transcriptional regulator YiaG